MSIFKTGQRQKSGYDLLQRTATDYFTPDTTTGKGPFLAKVLKVQQLVGGQGQLTWVDELENNFALENPDDPNPFASLTRVIIRARISGKYLAGQPNYHAHIPEPEKLGNEGEISISDSVYIDMHDEFVSLNETAAAQVPQVGDFVWVDYLEKSTRSKPVYIGPLKGVMGVATTPPCGVQTTPSANFNKTPPAGKNTGSPAPPQPGVRGIKGTLPPKDNKYVLHGYKLEDFTKQKGRFLKEPWRSQLNKLVSGVEVMHWYLQQLYPGSKINIYDPKAATTWGHAAKSSHKWGIGLDFKAKVNGKKLSNTRAWAIIIKLIVTGKIPDGGVGFYQTATGPNKGLSTTYGTKRPPSGCPHWDPAYPQPGEEIYKNPPLLDKKGNPVLDKKGKPKRKMNLPKESGYTKRKWYWGTRNGKKVTRNTSQTAQDLLKRPKVPRYAIQEFAGLPDPDSKMPTWENVIAMRGQQSKSTSPVKPAAVPPAKKSPAPPAKPKAKGQPPAGDKPKPTAEPKAGDKSKPADKPKKPTDAETAEALAAIKAATKAAAGGVDPATLVEKKAKADANSSPAKAAAKVAIQAATAITNCAQPAGTPGTPGAAVGGVVGGTAPAKSQTGFVNKGTKITFPAKGKPKALYSNENVTTDVYTSKRDVLKNVTMFILHETAGHGTSYYNAYTRTKKIKEGKMRTAKVKNPNWKKGMPKKQKYLRDAKGKILKRETNKPYTNWNHVHFWGGRAGDTALTTPLNKPCAHANWCNWISVGIEVINMSNVAMTKGRQGDKITEGYKYLHPLGNVGGTAQSSGKGNGLLKHPTAIFGSRAYMLPSERQCRMCWELIRWLAGPHRPHKADIRIPILFPATANHKKLSTGFKSSIGGGAPIFIWGRMNVNVASFKGKPYESSWDQNLPRGSRFKPKHHWQQGIVAHHRWHHSDGVFQEYYCLGRALGMSSKEAYFAAIGGMCATNRKNNSKINAGRNNFTYFPDEKTVNYGKKIWGSNGPLNWPQRHASLVTGKKKYGKKDVANNKTKWTKVLA